MFITIILITIIAAALFAVLIPYLKKLSSKKVRLTELRKRWLEGIEDGWDFERFIGDLFTALGYKVNVTKGSRDFGVDIVVWEPGEPVTLQAKFYTGSIKRYALEESLVGATIYGTRRTGVITTGEIPRSLYKLAREIEKRTFVKEIVLLGRTEIEEMLRGMRLV